MPKNYITGAFTEIPAPAGLSIIISLTMARNYAHTTKEGASPAVEAPGWRDLAYLSLTLLLGWVTFSSSSPRLFWQFWLHIALVLLLERLLSRFPLPHRQRYRLAFLGSIGLGAAVLAGGFFASPALSAGGAVAILLVSGCGAVAGGVLASGINQCFWENNAPPSQQIQQEVFRRHYETIGTPPFGSPAKRAFDILLALLGMLLSFPAWFLITFLVWFEDPGPVLFVKNSVGKGGKNFHQFKFRTMIREAEHDTGPVLASEGDERVLVIGRFLRKTALDELPQLINILIGDMSFVGPRPQRTILVRDYLIRMPEYAERHCVRPGLAGLAQVAGDYYLTPRQKLRFDRLYIRYASLAFDLKLIALAFLLVFWFRWRKDWDGRIPRRLLRLGRV
jgi:lipopolysaccharide/colanic/teichoic acid biosynthesis glycosyltransferase